MAGPAGRLTVRLSAPVVVTAVTIDHAPAATALRRGPAPNGTAPLPASASAPRSFAVYGLYALPAGGSDAAGAGAEAAAAAAAGDTDADGVADASLLLPSRFARVPLGSFAYDAHGPATQTFVLPPGAPQSAASHVMLDVTSNHGHPAYTCLYRFRVHGAPDAA